jgi:hypothetical protein
MATKCPDSCTGKFGGAIDDNDDDDDDDGGGGRFAISGQAVSDLPVKLLLKYLRR